MIGKWHLSSTDPTGFDYWEVLRGQGPYYNPRCMKPGRDESKHEGYTTEIITDLGARLADKGRDKASRSC